MVPANVAALPSLPIQLFSGFLFPCVSEVSYVDSRARPGLFSSMDSCVIVALCGRTDAGVSYVTILVTALWMHMP